MLLAGLAALIVAIIAGLQYWRIHARDAASEPLRHVPSVYCELSDFMRVSVTVSFDFAVERAAGARCDLPN